MYHCSYTTKTRSRRANNSTTFARHWYHSEHLLVDGTPMNKSKGNYYTLGDPRGRGSCPPMAVRYALLSGHPRKQLNCALIPPRGGERATRVYAVHRSNPARVHDQGARCVRPRTHFLLHDELNFPAALGAIFTLINRKGGEADQASFDRAMFALGLDLKHATPATADIPAAILLSPTPTVGLRRPPRTSPPPAPYARHSRAGLVDARPQGQPLA